ncbi:DUF423 domain-containing protein [Crocinitomicaceae bacterium]|jgi:uncharacterized membrane protein YgdD (TMEM256/DUF423 family)|nr:DUF423 domain-containing protein [Crocinitomicaceae bacterium]|tara:strand:- start:152 stop:535 length:384 start_codon:yes stop_codon:yes gene_type:complete
MNKKIVVTGAVLILIGIILGAFGAHSLKKVVDSSQVLSFETGVRYQIYHGFALIILGVNADRLLINSKWVIRFILLGVAVFSLSIYLMVMQGPMGLSLKFLGPITPIGGLLMVLGWVLFIKNLLLQK